MYEAKNFDNLLGTKGFSDKLLQNHFKLYQGYVTNTNKLLDAVSLMLKENKAGTLEYSELKRRFGWEFNGMRLHELYFENMNKKKTELAKNSLLLKKIISEFGSFENWEKDFKSLGSIRGIGWVMLSYDTNADKLFNIWINEHDVGHLSTTTPLLVMDVFEHAFILDYGLNRADYIAAFFNAIDWQAVERRFANK